MHYPLYDFAESANRTRAVLQLPHAAAPLVCRKANDKGALVRKNTVCGFTGFCFLYLYLFPLFIIE